MPALPRALPVALAAALVALAAAGCTRAGGGAEAAVGPEGLPDQESWGAVLRISQAGRPRVVLAAPYLARYDRPDSNYVRLGADPALGTAAATADSGAVAVTLYDDAGQPAARVRAGELVYLEAERRFTARGRVVVRAPGGRVLAAEEIAWGEDTRRLRAPGAFTFTSPTERIEGVGLVAEEDLSRYAFARGRGTLEVQE